MAEIRPFAEGDLSPVALMFAKVFPEAEHAPQSDVREYIRAVFLKNPWYDPTLPSQVAQDADGTIIGFLGVVPRHMLWRGRRIRVVVSLNLMVAPERRASLAAIELLKTLFRGPQDLTLTDGAGEQGRAVWEGLGGETCVLHSLFWTRPVRPARFLLSRARRRGWTALPFALASPVAGLSDALAMRLPGSRLRLAPRGRAVDATPAELIECQRRFSEGYSLRPDYDETSLAWVLARGTQLNGAGRLTTAIARNHRGDSIGAFVHSITDDGRCSVIQVIGHPGAFSEVLDVLLYDAWTKGATFVNGRLIPSHAQDLSDRYCLIDRRGPWMQIHSRHLEILQAINRGAVCLTRLDGEWALRFRHW